MSKSPFSLERSCIKTLSAVEAERNRSNQHEFNGVIALKNLFGLEKFKQDAYFSIRGESVNCIKPITWYDAREEHSTRTEHRLYFSGNVVMDNAQEGDNIVIGFDKNNKINIILIKRDNSEYKGPISSWE
ncbi:type II restriction endonuclease [Pectobacterium actinidiae]|uniref:type II restriction endonuclease n=1 Tax=Pectobacterium actinidiae TaxID=1507808 RepID=UPI0023AACB44|nr:type II restriction endonuclease [Pectobacterium actinidiae]MDY4317034.1 type II restriction endonuclease [Pectobacterium actinidiae]WEF12095.1 type II restriction endonuclease [Pectobacterium actinidiae]